MKTQKGFTLIELLVVIAIIGMMSSIVLASLNSARAKASDAAIKADLANLRSQASLYYDANSSFSPLNAGGNCLVNGTGATMIAVGGTCSGNLVQDPTFIRGVYAASAASGNSGYANVSPTDWAVFIPLKSNSSNWWCVDATGASKVELALPNTTFTVCP